MNKRTNIFNIPLSCSFWDTVAEIYLKKYQNDDIGLSEMLFLVPNRRACQSLINAFVRQKGVTPAILPEIVPIAEIDDDELFFSGALTSFADKTVISKEERLFLFVRLIMSKPNTFGLKQISSAQALSLAIDLANLIDTVSTLGLSFDKLQDLVPEKYATHWQETLKLLKIITEYWPLILKERNAVDLCNVRKDILFKQAEIWQKSCTTRHIVAAGITASFPQIVAILQVIAELPKGEIYFAGVDTFADDLYWSYIDETHPQFELKELLEKLKIDRSEITEVVSKTNPLKEQFISELMRPAEVSDAWRRLNNKMDTEAILKGMEVINCDTERDEATAIALKMREVLTYPEKTAALITYDRNLARRVATELARFDINIDDSAGMPFHLCPLGIFLRLIMEAAEELNSEVKLFSLLKHPFALFRLDAAEFRDRVYRYEITLRQQRKIFDEENMGFIENIYAELTPFSDMLKAEKISFETALKTHIELAEKIASSKNISGDKILWQGNAGKCGAQFITKILASAKSLGDIRGSDYPALLSTLMSMETVRANYGMHPRLSILGPIEARLCHFDYVILGEVNEGVWPKPANADMWMSRPMKKDFGFALPEKNIGILAADLCCFLAADNVILTRAERVDGVPMKKSRWLLRLQTVLKALGSDIEQLINLGFYKFIHNIDKPSHYQPIKSPQPTPPVTARPRSFSASAVDLLMSDPYSFYARYILKLYPLNDLDMPLDQRAYGTLIHAIIEDFNNQYPEALPDNALEILLELGKKHFAEQNIAKELAAFWIPKFAVTAHWIIQQERDYRFEVVKVNNEIKGEIKYTLPAGDVSFTAIADRVDVLKDGKINIIDYKTGNIPTDKQLKNGYALQLPLEGLIAQRNGFVKIQNKEVEDLIYWQLGKKDLKISAETTEILEKCEAFLLELVKTFDNPNMPYHFRPVPKFIIKNRDYEHLARVREWSVLEESEE